jgi:membrane fusion protein, adhesin transport system
MTLRRSHAAAPRLQPGDAALMSELRAATTVQVLTGTRAVLWLMLLCVIAAVAWAALARVNQVTRADGRVVPAGREQVIASLEGGILRELHVREGMQVTQGQALAQLDPTRFEAQQNEGQAKRLALIATSARLQAEATGQALAFPPELAPTSPFRSAESAAHRARQRALDEALQANARSIELLSRELQTAQAMAAKGLMSEVEVLRLQRQVNELNLQSQERSNRFRQEASTELVRVRAELAQLAEQIEGRADVLRRTVLRSPVQGLVKNIRASTLGGVVAPGAAVMEIVPTGGEVWVEARIKPAEIGFVQVGQPVQFKLSAYDFNTYGGLHGRIASISPDALGDPERAAAGADATYYRALLQIESSTLRAQGLPLPVLPGMTGTAEVQTGERSVLSFLLRPMLRANEAFTER